MTLPEQLLSAVKGIYTGLDVRIREVAYGYSKSGLSINGNFYYLSFKNGVPTAAEFAEYVYHRIIPYCLPRKLRAEKDAQYVATKDPRFIHELTDQAKNLFIKAKKSQSKSGEPGEVILFILLEAILSAPQIVCKMYLKTSEQMPVHGSDGVHLGVSTKAGALRLYWGESKLYGEIAKAFDDIFESIGNFISAKSGRSPKERDLEIIIDHMDIDDAPLKQLLLKYFDPYEEESLAVEEIFACFTGFDYDAYQMAEPEFKKRYEEKIESACELFFDKMQKAGLEKLQYHIFLLPFPNVKDFRKYFFAHLGLSDVS